MLQPTSHLLFMIVNFLQQIPVASKIVYRAGDGRSGARGVWDCLFYSPCFIVLSNSFYTNGNRKTGKLTHNIV